MKQWHPVPAQLAAALVKKTWTKENQAPEAVAYMWAWSVMRNGVNVSIRDMANYAGWSKWRARIMREQVRLDYEAWESEPHQTGQPPDSSRTVAGQQPDTKPQQSRIVTKENQTATGQQPDSNRTVAGRSRVIPYTNTKTTTTTKHTTAPAGDGVNVAKVWERIEERRKATIPGSKQMALTKQRRKVLKARLTEHSEEELIAVVEWWLKSRHPRAGYLRENGHGIDTVLRASNFAQYLDFSKEREKKKTKTIPPRSPNKRPELPGIENYTVEQVDQAKESIAELRKTMQPGTWKRAVLTVLSQEVGN